MISAILLNHYILLIMERMDGKKRKPTIFASEIGQYHYCPVAWYLKKSGYKPSSPHLNLGMKKHNRYGEILKRRTSVNTYSKWFIICGILGLSLSFVLLILEVLL